jgi:hypothetical protein
MKWKEHTSTDNFAAAFQNIMDKYSADNEERAGKIEEFMITEAQKAGVIKSSKIRSYKNPNRWDK